MLNIIGLIFMLPLLLVAKLTDRLYKSHRTLAIIILIILYPIFLALELAILFYGSMFLLVAVGSLIGYLVEHVIVPILVLILFPFVLIIGLFVMMIVVLIGNATK